MATPRSIAGSAVLLLLLPACGGGSGASAERFCGEVDANKALLTDPVLVYSDDVEPLLAKYREIADLAPLAIEPEWRQLVSTYETASTVVVGDAASEQTALAAAYQSEEAAVAVAEWLRANCAVEIGPLATIVDPNPTIVDPTIDPTVTTVEGGGTDGP